ncbi:MULTISPECIES: alpha/beta fold hydrolase [Antarcticibacterium]|uniref:alpha/beta fold hydrolase n=1 Tax=Antarcticibacterium sp. W02-3 TaxID=2183747 RepID=UPI00143D2B72|nr:alpha/beta fold hydrolase [Antarcticibacterium flavum]
MDLHSSIIGEGKPFIILHGFLGMGDNWKTLGNQFAEDGYEVHLLDQRNHGRSPHIDEMNYSSMAQDVVAYCEKRNLENIVLLGHSMGGKVAMQVAGEAPYLVEKLIVVDISPRYYSPHHQQILEGLTALDEASLTSRGEAEDFLSKFIKEKGIRLFLLKNLYWKTKEKLALRLNLEVLKENVEEVGKALGSGIKFDKETLFVKGGKSNYITVDDKPLIDLHFPNVRLEEISGAGHWVHAEKQKEFYNTVKQYLDNK